MKIFIVVGSMFPFDRLVTTIDNWAKDQKDIIILGQIGSSTYIPRNMIYFETLSARDFNTYFSESDLVVSHAGMGVILKSLVENKPIVVMPRLLKYKEVTTDHQLATAKALRNMNYINVAMCEEELVNFLQKPEKISIKHKIGDYASDNLIRTIREFINNN